MHRKYKINCVPYTIFMTGPQNFCHIDYSNSYIDTTCLLLKDIINYTPNIVRPILSIVYLERTYGN